MFEEQTKLQERLERLEREITHRRASSDPKSSEGRVKKSPGGYSRRKYILAEREVMVKSAQGR